MTSFALKFEFLMLSTLVKKADKYLYKSGVSKNAIKCNVKRKNCCDYCFENCQRISVKIALEIAWEIQKLPGNSLGNSLGNSFGNSENALEIALDILKLLWKLP